MPIVRKHHDCEAHNLGLMRPRWKSRTAVGTAWTLALLVGLFEARYLVKDPPWLLHMQAMMLMRHPIWLRLHIAGGIVALLTGLFQFLTTLRTEHPRIHRLLGRIYVASILIGGAAGLRLSPDTPLFIVQGLMEARAFGFSFVGMRPTLPGYGLTSTYSPAQFFLAMLGFVALAVVWLATTGVAFIRIRQGRVSDHRAWMTRSYALTFAAVTVRLVSLPLEVVTRNPVMAITFTFWSWVLNLVVAEWLLRRERIASFRVATAAS